MKRLIVIDTNVVLSALQSKNGKSFALISKIGGVFFDFAISVPLVLEYEAILKNHLDRNIFTDSDITVTSWDVFSVSMVGATTKEYTKI